MTYTDEEYIMFLRFTAKRLGVEDIANEALNDKQFLFQSGCHSPCGHHYGEGGLLKHTYEVCTIAMTVAGMYRHDHDIDMAELFLSALFHDYGKIWDYDYDIDTDEFTSSPHKRTIHHISRSAIEWNMIAQNHDVSQELIDRVTHNILSHHGQRSFGSPVAPHSREAWILHCADQLSARIDDCDRLDMITINK